MGMINNTFENNASTGRRFNVTAPNQVQIQELGGISPAMVAANAAAHRADMTSDNTNTADMAFV